MKIAIPMYGINVSLHYGHSEGYILFDIDSEKKVVNKKTIMNGGIKGCEAASLLSELNVDTVIAGGIGENAKRNLENRGIQVLLGATENVDKVIEKFLNNTLELNEEICEGEGHHHHQEGHQCCSHHHE